jgi:hypothetical protein
MRITNAKNIVISAIFYSIVGFIGVFMAFYPTILSGFSRMQAELGDTRLNNYFLEHSFQVAFNRGYIGSLWSPSFFYPFKNALAMSDNLWGSAPLYWLFRCFSSPDLSFQLWMVSVTLLCFISFVILLRYLKVSPILSAMGGFLFAFGTPRMMQLLHQQLLPQFYMAFTILFAIQFLNHPSNRLLILTLLFCYLQLLAGIYLGWFLLLSLPIFSVFLLYQNQDLQLKLKMYFANNILSISIILLISLFLIGLLLLPYVQMSHILGGRSIEEVSTTIPSIFSWVSPPEASTWSSLLLEPPLVQYLRLPWYKNLFMGFSVIGLTMLTFYIYLKEKQILGVERAHLVKACLMIVSLIFIVSMKELDLWKFVYWSVPGASAIRGVARVSLILYFFLLLAILLSLDSWLKSKILNHNWKLITASLICSIALYEQILIHPTSFEKAPILALESKLQNLMVKGCDLAYVSFGQNENSLDMVANQLAAVWAGLKAGVPVVNGYSSGPPPNYLNFDHIATTSDLQRWLKDDFKGQLCLISLGQSDNGIQYESSIVEFPLVP